MKAEIKQFLIFCLLFFLWEEEFELGNTNWNYFYISCALVGQKEKEYTVDDVVQYLKMLNMDFITEKEILDRIDVISMSGAIKKVSDGHFVNVMF